MRRFNVPSPRIRLLLLSFCSLLVIVAILNLSPWLILSLPANASLAEIWHKIFRNPPPPPRQGGSRGDDFCPIAPVAWAVDASEHPQTSPSNQQSLTAELPKVWSDRPTLAWFGTSTAVREMAIFPKDSPTPIWVWSNPKFQHFSSRTPSEPRDSHHVRVEAQLAPGQIYEWRVIRPLTPEQDIIRFQTMTSSEIKSIQQSLSAADITDNSSALERADFFAGHHLWSDFWQEIFSVQSPSTQMSQLVTQTFESQCPRRDDFAQP